MTARLAVLSGGVPPFVDPWHPFEAVARRVAALGTEAGFDVETTTDVAGRLADLTDVDVLAVVAPSPAVREPGEAGEEALDATVRGRAAAGLESFLARQVGVLGVHVGTTGLLGLPRWTEIIGARWVPGVSGHPPLGPAVLRGLPDPRVPAERIELVDERYSGLEFAAGVVPLVDHERDGRRQPLVWAREVGTVRVIADTLGHDERSFDSPEHRELLTRCLAWLGRR